jgi:hypothetical protein
MEVVVGETRIGGGVGGMAVFGDAARRRVGWWSLR